MQFETVGGVPGPWLGWGAGQGPCLWLRGWVWLAPDESGPGDVFWWKTAGGREGLYLLNLECVQA